MTDVKERPDGRAGAKPFWRSTLERLGFGSSSPSQYGSSRSHGQPSIAGKPSARAPRGKTVSPNNAATLQRSGVGIASALSKRRQEAWSKCEELARQPRILDRFAEDLARCGVVGETRAGKLAYLALSTRFLSRPVSAVIKGPSSAGKSHFADKVLPFFPSSAYYALSGMSERALAYGEEPLKHRFLVVTEASGLASGTGAYLLRTLISEGRLRYETVEKSDGRLGPRLIEREGPTGLLLTTTRVRLDAELETRLFSIPMDDSPEQTSAVMVAVAADGAEEPVDLSRWHALQEWLETAKHRVVIPFGDKLARLIPPIAVRLRRDFGATLALIKAHAILHQASREQDVKGRVIATLEDYAAVRELVADLVAEGVEATVPASVRETIEAVRRSLKRLQRSEVPLRPIRECLGLDKSTASRRLQDAIERGYVRNLEERSGKDGRYVLGDPLPEEIEILPQPHALDAHRCSVADQKRGMDGQDREHSGPNGGDESEVLFDPHKQLEATAAGAGNGAGCDRPQS